MLVSSLLTYETLSPSAQNDVAYASHLETYTATAWYHKKLPADLGDLKKATDAAREFAFGEYLTALAKGNRMGDSERQAVAQKVARFTGLSADYVQRANLRIDPARFRKELLRDRRLVVGRLDSRFTGPLASAVAETYDADPSHDAIAGPYAAAWNHYVRSELGYENDLPYVQISAKASEEWSFKEFEGKAVNVAPKLARAMRANPHLRVHVAYGYHDGATPYFAAQDVIAHLQIPASLRDNIEHAYYEAGHMMYVHEPSLAKFKTEVANFIDNSHRDFAD